MVVVSCLDVIEQLWGQAGLPLQVLKKTVGVGNVVLAHDPREHGQAVRSSFQLTAIAQGCTAAIALAHEFYASLVDADAQQGGNGGRTGSHSLDDMVLGRVCVDARHAIAEYKGWVRIYAPQHATEASMQHMLKNSISAGSDQAKELLDIDKHAVADWDPLAGLYRTQGEAGARKVPGVVRIHTNFPHHKLGILQLLSLVPESVRWNDAHVHEQVFARFTRADVAREVQKWEAFQLEAAAQARGLCVTAYRSEAEWSESPMGKAVQEWMRKDGGAAFRISRIPSSESEPKATQHIVQRGGKASKRLRVIDMSRVIAGPISTRTLAVHGADVLLVSSPHLPNLPLRELETARGKRTAFLHLDHKADHGKAVELPAEVQALVQEADVFSQAYRPGGLAERGLGADQLQAVRPGIVYAELNAFGFAGPWADKRAYDSLTQTACGLNYLESLSYLEHKSGAQHGTEQGEVEPRALPVQALDYAAGSLLCFATLACKCRALLERSQARMAAQEGWRVQVSLASTAEWIKSLGQIHGDEAWTRPPEDVIPSDAAELAAITSRFRVRGRHNEQGNDVYALAIRHASIPEGRAAEQGGLRWTVPAHLGVDQLEWCADEPERVGGVHDYANRIA